MSGHPARTFPRFRPHSLVRESPEQVYGNPVFHFGSRPGILFVVVRVDGVRRRTSLYFGPGRAASGRKDCVRAGKDAADSWVCQTAAIPASADLARR
jgi:hypothetical protein